MTIQPLPLLMACTSCVWAQKVQRQSVPLTFWSADEKRCGVLEASELAPDLQAAKLAAAAYIHLYNAPKDHAAQARAVDFARNRMLISQEQLQEAASVSGQALSAQPEKHLWTDPI